MSIADNPPRPAPARASVLALVVLAILLCSPCLGLGGGLAYVNAALQGRFARWRSLAAPPSGAVALITADPNLVYVETASAAVFACAHNGRAAGAGCWAAAEPPFDIAPQADFERAVFSGDVPPPPGDLVDQLPVSIILADAGFEARYAVLGDGTVWVWEYSAGGYDSLAALLLGPVVGLGAGLLVIGLLVLLGRAHRRAAPAA
jgi:hypothetical protein